MLNVQFSKSALVVFSISWQDHTHTLPYSNWHFFFFLINFIGVFVVIIQLLSCVQLFAPPWTAAHQTLLSFITFWSLLKLLSIESVLLSNHLILCCPLLLLLSIFPSIRAFSNESLLPISGQSIGASASASVLPMNIQDWFPLWLIWSPCSPRDSQESSPKP